MKKIIFGVLALILFFAILNFGPNGIQTREKDLDAAVAAAKAADHSTPAPGALATSPAPTVSDSAPVTSAPTAAPRIDTDTAPPTPAPAPAPVAIAATTPPPTETTSAAPAPAAEPAPAAARPSEAPAPVPPVVATTPAPAAPEPTPAPTEKVTPAAMPAPSPETSVASVTTPEPVATPTPSAPVVTPAPAVVKMQPKAKLAGPKVMILGYYRFTEPGAGAGNPNRLSIDLFQQQLTWLQNNNFQVIPLSQLVTALKNGTPLPDHAVVITINNGFSSALTLAAPALQQYKYPWSFLVYTDFIEQSQKAVAWTNLLALSKENVEFGSQSKSHPWLTDMGGKTPEAYDKWLNSELTGSKRMLELKLKQPVSVFAYPYGATNDVVTKKALAVGYDVLLDTAGEEVTSASSPQHLSRLIVNQFTAPYFETILSQKPFHVTNTQPAAGTLIRNAHPGVISATLNYAGNIRAKSVQAELSSGGSYKNIYDPATKTITIPLKKDLLEGPVIVVIKAKDQDTGAPIAVYWQFYYQK